MSLREYTPSDYETVKQWWLDNGWDHPMPEEFLPGIASIDEGKSAAFLYSTDANSSCIAWLVANPDIAAREKLESLVSVINSLIPPFDNHLVVTFAMTSGIVTAFKKSRVIMANEFNKHMIYLTGDTQ